MKKTYSKPEIVFEDFTLSTSIATCKTDIDDLYFPGVGYPFHDGCDIIIPEDGNSSYNGICYLGPVASNSAFNS